MSSRFDAVILLVVTLLFAGCASFYAPEKVSQTLQSTLAAAERQHLRGNDMEAAQLIEAAFRVDEELEGGRELRESLSPDIEYLYDHPLLGSNFAHRAKAERSVTAKIFLYLPDRLLDMVDIVSFDVHFGIGLFANVHLTRAVQVGAGGRGVGGLGWHDHRSLGAMGQAESGVALPGFGAQAYAASIAGTSGVSTTTDATAGLHKPSSKVYQEFRDYWAVGAAITAVLVGVEVDLHPVELADLFLGFAGVDALHDDFAHTKGLRLSRSDRRLLRVLSEMERSEETLEAYHQSRLDWLPSELRSRSPLLESDGLETGDE